MNNINIVRVNDVSIDSFIGSHYIESPEWIRVVTDSEDKVLAGIRASGELEWSLGVPTPVREYVEEYVQEQMDDALELKVDKEDGKSLIDASVARRRYRLCSSARCATKGATGDRVRWTVAGTFSARPSG